jgi:putative ABC transport system permease protein
MSELVGHSISRQRLYAVLMGVFAAIAVTLAVIGIYGLMAYTVVRRTREIGIRMALGARRATVLRLVVGHSAALTAIGLAIGIVSAAGLTQWLEGLLFGLTPLDRRTFAAVGILFAAIAAVAALVPARRAARVDPALTLRCE